MRESRISVVIPCYKSDLYIKRALDSIIVQSCKPYEVILIDDFSGGESIVALRNIVGIYKKKLNISLIELTKNSGVGNARNVGWNKAVGEFIAFLDSDDSWHPKKLEIQDIFLNNHKNIDLVGSLSFKCIDNKHPIMPNYYDLKFTEVKFDELLRGNPIHISSVMVRSRVPMRFVDSQRFMEDHRFLLELSANKICIYRCQNSFSNHFKFAYGDFGLSLNLWQMEKFELMNFLWAYKRGFIGILVLIITFIYSILRFARRYSLVKVRSISYFFDFT